MRFLFLFFDVYFHLDFFDKYHIEYQAYKAIYNGEPKPRPKIFDMNSRSDFGGPKDNDGIQKK